MVGLRRLLVQDIVLQVEVEQLQQGLLLLIQDHQDQQEQLVEMELQLVFQEVQRLTLAVVVAVVGVLQVVQEVLVVAEQEVETMVLLTLQTDPTIEEAAVVVDLNLIQ